MMTMTMTMSKLLSSYLYIYVYIYIWLVFKCVAGNLYEWMSCHVWGWSIAWEKKSGFEPWTTLGEGFRGPLGFRYVGLWGLVIFEVWPLKREKKTKRCWLGQWQSPRLTGCRFGGFSLFSPQYLVLYQYEIFPRYSYHWENWMAKNHQLGDDMHAVVRFAKMYLAMHVSWRIILVLSNWAMNKTLVLFSVYRGLYYPI